MSQAIGTVGGVYVAILLGITALLLISVANPAVFAAINAGRDPVAVILTYATFWTDWIWIISSAFFLGSKIFFKGLTLLATEFYKSTSDAGVISAFFKAFLEGNLLGFLNYFAPWQNLLTQIGIFIPEVIFNGLYRLTNTISPGQALATLEKLVAW